MKSLQISLLQIVIFVASNAIKLQVKKFESNINRKYCNFSMNFSNVEDGVVVNGNGMFHEDLNNLTVIKLY